VLAVIWDANAGWMANHGTSVRKTGVEQRMAATAVVGTYIIVAYAMLVRLESWWLCFVGEIGLVVVSVNHLYVCREV
jgi:hypothetical protein